MLLMQMADSVDSSQILEDLTSNYGWTILKVIVINVFAFIGTVVMQISMNHSLFMTHTQQVGTEVFQLALFQIINFFAVPVIAHTFNILELILGNSSETLFTRGTMWCAPPLTTEECIPKLARESLVCDDTECGHASHVVECRHCDISQWIDALEMSCEWHQQVREWRFFVPATCGGAAQATNSSAAVH